VREYQTDVAPADYVLFVDRKPIGIIEAKREDEGFPLERDCIAFFPFPYLIYLFRIDINKLLYVLY